MRTASAQLEAAISARVTTLCRLWRVTRKDGQVLRFTDAVRPVSAQIDPDGTVQTYRSDISFTASSIFMSKSLANQQSVNMQFLLDDAGFSETDLRTRKYDDAIGEVFVCDFEHPEYGVMAMFKGVFGQVTLSNQKVGTVDVVPEDAASNGVGIGLERFSQTCRASLFDSRCKLVATDFKKAFTVTSANSGIVVSADLTEANGHWALGFVKWLTGANAGTRSTVTNSDKASTTLFLSAAPSFPIAVGDTGEVYPGCDKTRTRCKQFNNLVNMRAEPDVPDGAPNAIERPRGPYNGYY